jgi:hypothetical protein
MMLYSVYGHQPITYNNNEMEGKDIPVLKYHTMKMYPVSNLNPIP